MLTVIAALAGLAIGRSPQPSGCARRATRPFAGARRSGAATVADAEREAETIRREAQVEAREQAVRLRAEIEARCRTAGWRSRRSRSASPQREVELEQKLDEVVRREQGIGDREVHLKQLQEEVKGARDSALTRARAHRRG